VLDFLVIFVEASWKRVKQVTAAWLLFIQLCQGFTGDEGNKVVCVFSTILNDYLKQAGDIYGDFCHEKCLISQHVEGKDGYA
jgi:hypothetical protein